MERTQRRRKSVSEPKLIVIPPAPEGSPFSFGFCEDKNATKRRKMEDSHAFYYDFGGRKGDGFFAVYDGHGGRSAADWCGEHFHEILLKNLYSEEEVVEDKDVNSGNIKDFDTTKDTTKGDIQEILNRTFLEADTFLDGAHGIYSGCTAIVALYKHDIDKKTGERYPVLYTGNVGDARAVLYRSNIAIRLSYDHKASDIMESQRIKDSGGFILHDRVNGMLAVTRALGDAEMKEFVTANPYTTQVRIDHTTDSLLILACDGLWDVCGDQEACDLVKDIMDPQQAAEILLKYGLDKGSFDNMSVLVIRFQQQ